jgi:hypothetical protein
VRDDLIAALNRLVRADTEDDDAFNGRPELRRVTSMQ